MNLRYVLRQLGLLLLVLSALIFAASLWDIARWFGGHTELRHVVAANLISVGVGVLVGGLTWLRTRRGDTYLGRREALLLVAMSWLIGAALAGLPFFLWAQLAAPADHPFRHFVDCYFEAMSGLTTTGATVLGGGYLPDGTPAPTSIEALPQSLLLWRAATHWIGGLGIVVLFVAVLPTLGVGGKKLFFAEAPGPPKAGLRPRIAETARVLLVIYLGLNLVEILLLRACGLSWFNAVCESFATIATGGFSPRNTSAAGYQSLAVEIILIVFMLLSGVNFALYFELAKGRFANVWRDRELRWYVGITVAACSIVVLSLINRRIITADGQELEAGVGAAVRYGTFAVSSTRTNTGFATADVDPWGFLAHFVLVAFMYLGACAGSTAGGVKLVRCLIAFKVLLLSIERAFRPNVVKPVRIGRDVVRSDMQSEAVNYLLLYALVLLAGGFAVHLIEPRESIDVMTAFTASAACLSNTGPGLGSVGTVQNYGWLTDASKVVLCVVMLLGRLEIFALFALFAPRFWRGE